MASWTFYGVNNPLEPFQNLGTIARSGFETTFSSDKFWAWSYAEASATNGSLIGASTITETVVLGSRLQNVTPATASSKSNHRTQMILLAMVVIFAFGFALGYLASLLLIFWQRSTLFRWSPYAPLQAFEIDAESEEIPVKDSVDKRHGRVGI